MKLINNPKPKTPKRYKLAQHQTEFLEQSILASTPPLLHPPQTYPKSSNIHTHAYTHQDTIHLHTYVKVASGEKSRQARGTREGVVSRIGGRGGAF